MRIYVYVYVYVYVCITVRRDAEEHGGRPGVPPIGYILEVNAIYTFIHKSSSNRIPIIYKCDIHIDI